jgi:hypothetical protein
MRKLEFLKRVNCLGVSDIEKVWSSPGEAHMVDLYIQTRKEGKSNFDFIFLIDEDYILDIFSYIGDDDEW